MLGPYRRKVVVASLLLVVWTGCVLAGPFLVRYAIDQGLTPGDVGALNLAVGLYVVVAALGYVVYRPGRPAGRASWASPSCGISACASSPT